jgi:hypothetical protein
MAAAAIDVDAIAMSTGERTLTGKGAIPLDHSRTSGYEAALLRMLREEISNERCLFGRVAVFKYRPEFAVNPLDE